MLTREICGVCNQINKIGYLVPDSIWVAVIPKKFHKSAVCLECFCRFGDEKLIEWDVDIKFFPVSFFSHMSGSSRVERLPDKYCPICGSVWVPDKILGVRPTCPCSCVSIGTMSSDPVRLEQLKVRPRITIEAMQYIDCPFRECDETDI